VIASDERTWGVAWALVTAAISIIVIAVMPRGAVYTAAPVSVLVFAFGQLLFPSVRPRKLQTICPVNWAMLMFFLQLVVLPLMMIILGVARGSLPFLPADRTINIAIALNCLGYVAFCAAYQASAKRAIAPAPPPLARNSMPVVFAGLGLLGMIATFRNFATIQAYFSDPQLQYEITERLQGSLAGLAGLILRNFLGIAAIAWWCMRVDRDDRRAPIRNLLALAPVAVVVFFVGATFSFNRAQFVYPMVALIAVYSMRVRRVPATLLAALGAGSIVPFVLWAFFRSSGVTLEAAIANASLAKVVLQTTDINAQIQVYGQAPQFLAFLLEQSHFAHPLYGGSTIIASIMSPVPVLGAPFREHSGPFIYNYMIYGPGAIYDQVIPFIGELFLNLHLPGIVLGYAGLGVATAYLQKRFMGASEAFEIYCWMFAAVWLLFLVYGSIAALSQICVYSGWPMYLFFIWRRRAGVRVQTNPVVPLPAEASLT
jgi:hypothetical protein